MQDTNLILPSDLPKEELLAMLAEEAAELAHAALKLRRVLDGTNPTPKTYDECEAALIEEMADVELCFALCDPYEAFTLVRMMDIKRTKYDRWVERLNDERRTVSESGH